MATFEILIIVMMLAMVVVNINITNRFAPYGRRLLILVYSLLDVKNLGCGTAHTATDPTSPTARNVIFEMTNQEK